MPAGAEALTCVGALPHPRQIVLAGSSSLRVRRRFLSRARRARSVDWQLSEVADMRHEFRVASAILFVAACGMEQKTPDQGAASSTGAQLEVRPSTVQLNPNDVQQFTLSPSTVQV